MKQQARRKRDRCFILFTQTDRWTPAYYHYQNLIIKYDRLSDWDDREEEA